MDDPLAGVFDFVGFGMQRLPVGHRIRRVDVEHEIGHNEEMVPQFMLEIGRIPQYGIDIAHYLDDDVRSLRTVRSSIVQR